MKDIVQAEQFINDFGKHLYTSDASDVFIMQMSSKLMDYVSYAITLYYNYHK